MSSEQLADGVNPLDAELAATWDVLKGYSGRDTDLGIARRFGGSSAAYSLRDFGAMNDSVVRVRREPYDTTVAIDDEERFSANQVQDGTLERWVNGKLESTLPADVATAAAAYSLRKVKASYGIPVTEVNGTDGFPTTIPTSGAPADIGNGFTVHKFSDGGVDSFDATHSGGVITVTVTKASASTFSSGLRIKGLDTGKQYTVSGEFRATSLGADGDGTATVDISDATAGTDEDTVSTTSTSFTPFFIDSGYNATDSTNFVDLQARSFGSNSGTITAEFRNIKIIENNNSAVRIRRSSDDEEVVVGFDSDDKVSASSPVTATPSGSTSATDLNGFLNEVFTVGVAVEGGSGGSRPDSFSNATNSSFTATVTATAGGYFPYKSAAGDAVTVSFDLVLSGGASPSINTSLGVDTVATRAAGTAYSSSGSYTFTLNCNASADHIRFADSDDGTFAITNFRVTSHTHQAFVHTWYDQAGSNNAVQETAANQPKIAENGALLTEDGKAKISYASDSTLTFNSSIATGTTFSLFAKFKPIGDNSRLIQNPSGAPRIDFEQGTPDVVEVVSNSFGNDKMDLKTSFLNNTHIFTLINNSTSVSAFSEAVGSSENPNTVTGNFTFTTLGGTNTQEHQEIILYSSNQTDNRFKIESNTNNYYGLYNDENELSTNWTENTTDPFDSSTFSANGKDGFTGTHTSSGSGDYARADITLKNPILQDKTIFISYNCKFNSGSPSPNLVGQQSDGTTNTFSSNPSVAEGFNSHSVTPTNGTTAIIQIVDNSTGSFTISDFKISLIARNGFVETWYDQSSNGRNMTQDTAAYQPAIIKNGGICKTANGYKTISFDGSDDYLVALGYSPAADSEGGMTDFNLTCVTGKPPSSTQKAITSMGSQEGSHVIGGFYFSNNINSGDSTKQDIRFNISEHDITTPTSTSHIDQKIISGTALNDTNLLSFNRRGSDNTFEFFNPSPTGTTLTGTSLIPKCGQTGENDDFKVGAAMYNNASQRQYQGDILEVMLFDSSDKRDDAPTINSEIEHYYNI